MNPLIRAVKPTLFDTTFYPDLVFNVLLANLMSEKLEELGHHAIHTPGPFSAEAEREHALFKLFHYLNGRFYHARPADFARIWGLQEREKLTDQEALKANDYTLEILKDAYHHVQQFKPYAHLLNGFLESGLFPEYVYPTVDIVLRLAQTLPPTPNHPLGITSCADECILIASLAFIRQCCNLDEIVIFGSPLHYILFLFPEGSDGYLFNGKREFFTAASWRETASASEHETVRNAFLSRVFTCDRLITANGSWIFPLNQGSIPYLVLLSTIEKISRFLDLDISSAMPLIGKSLEYVKQQRSLSPLPETDNRDESPGLIAALNPSRSPGEIARITHNLAFTFQNERAVSVWYTARLEDVPHPEIYPEAALTGYKVWLSAGGVLTVRDAMEMVRRIPGKTSVFEQTGRIALPDEVLLFQTASDRERVLLFYALLKLSVEIPVAEKELVKIVLNETCWMVDASGRTITGKDLY